MKNLHVHQTHQCDRAKSDDDRTNMENVLVAHALVVVGDNVFSDLVVAALVLALVAFVFVADADHEFPLLASCSAHIDSDLTLL